MTNPQEGFAGAQTALAETRNTTQWINTQVSEGRLRLNPETAEAAAKYCEDFETRIEVLRTRSRQLARIEGLGDYDSALALRHHFEQKAIHPQSGALALLNQLRTELLDLADAYRNAGRAYREQEELISGDLRKGLR